ncbi:hypothetical protein NDU88_005471 [Pleurodeles waltl]|uniref:Uncharacterized protein n=1 Tax=Pleurodeles waltl TaxID=8319 RepID=A0AAV7W9M7_PLEWA|nr:hypothetical protein NDU88_005471 [Pleurodeles waltl]
MAREGRALGLLEGLLTAPVVSGRHSLRPSVRPSGACTDSRNDHQLSGSGRRRMRQAGGIKTRAVGDGGTGGGGRGKESHPGTSRRLPSRSRRNAPASQARLAP